MSRSEKNDKSTPIFCHRICRASTDFVSTADYWGQRWPGCHLNHHRRQWLHHDFHVQFPKINLIDLAFRSQHGSVMLTDRPATAPVLLTTQQAADRLGLTTSALHELRCRDDGLPIVQKGLLVGYPISPTGNALPGQPVSVAGHSVLVRGPHQDTPRGTGHDQSEPAGF